MAVLPGKIALALTALASISPGSGSGLLQGQRGQRVVGDTGASPLAFNLAPVTHAVTSKSPRGWKSDRVWGDRARTRGTSPCDPALTAGWATLSAARPFRRPSRAGDLLMSESGASTGGFSGGAPWITRGLKRLVRGRRGRREGSGGVGKGSPLPSLSSVMEALDAKESNGSHGAEKMAEVLASPLPSHPQVREGVLPNGLRYIILPNSSPPERFEAHLEVFAGSADELDSQQGMAHLVEHITYMGSRKRERLFGTGSQTNAYTDFHHTVFYASCPVMTPPGWGRRTPMLGRALGALCDVLEAVVEESRLEKERSAVLSELTMVNTIDYRMECQILAALHAENQLSRRFPIGKDHLIRNWSSKDVLEFHRAHYRPENAMVYCIGDLDLNDCEEQIRKTFGHLGGQGGKPDAQGPLTLKAQSRHFPPVTHHWSGGQVTEENTLPVMESVDNKPLGRPRVFGHDLLQAFSLHVFAKRPIEPVSTLGDLRRSVMKRIALAALQIRLSVNSRTDPPFLSIEFNQLDSPREGCAVCYLDMTADASKWKQAVKLAVREIRRLGMYGLSEGELTRFSSALLTDARQLASQGNRLSNGDTLTFLMEAIASGHTFMDTQQNYLATRLVVESLTLQEVNEVAAEVCEHITLFGVPTASQPSAMVACVPTLTPEGVSIKPQEGVAEGLVTEASGIMSLTEEDVLDAFQEGVREEVKENADIEVPESFFTPEEVQALVDQRKPAWVPMTDPKATGSSGVGELTPDKLAVVEPETGTTLRRLENGIRVNMGQHKYESQRGQLRIVLPGGRQLESALGRGSVAIGARTMQEGGTFGNWVREQVELFCIDHLIMVTVDANDEYLYIDLAFPTTKLHARGEMDMGEEGSIAGEGNTPSGGWRGGDPDDAPGLSGIESAFQVLHQILTGFVWEEDALNRAKQSFLQSHETLMKSLEGRSTEALMDRMSNADLRFMSIPSEGVEEVDLEMASNAITSQLSTSVMEISLVGDFDMEEAERLCLQYVGTVPPSERKAELSPVAEDIPHTDEGEQDGTENARSKHIDIHLPDSDDRAVGYVAGEAPNRWGVMRGGGSVLDLSPPPNDAAAERRKHPLFCPVALALLKEVVNRRLFSVVREQKRLTYDANMHLTNFERLQGSWYLITVTANPDKVDEAIKACQDTIRAMSGALPVTADNIESAKRVLINRHENDLRTNMYWCDLLSGLQLDCLPQKDMTCIRDYNSIVNSITAQDLQQMLKGLTVNPKEMYTCAGVSGQKPEPRADKN